MTKYAECEACGYAIQILEDTNPEDYFCPSCLLPLVAGTADMKVYTKPLAGKRRIINMYYNPDTGLPEFEVET